MLDMYPVETILFIIFGILFIIFCFVIGKGWIDSFNYLRRKKK